MFCLTIVQPYALMVAEGVKTYEFMEKRPGRAKWGQRVGIHAAQKMDSAASLRDMIIAVEENGPAIFGIKDAERAIEIMQRAIVEPKSFRRSAILGTAKLRTPVRVKDIIKVGVNIAGVDLDLWALPFVNPKPVKQPLAIKGQSTWWQTDKTLKGRNPQCS